MTFFAKLTSRPNFFPTAFLLQVLLTLVLMLVAIVGITQRNARFDILEREAIEAAHQTSLENQQILEQVETLTVRHIDLIRANEATLEGLLCILSVLPEDRTDEVIESCLRGR